jgi:ubiquinone biosynthesis protein UbiJ
MRSSFLTTAFPTLQQNTHKLFPLKHRKVPGDSKLLSMAYTFQTKNNQIKLLTEYESVTQTVLLFTESILRHIKQLQHARLSRHVKV